MRILLVEDEPLIALAAADALTDAGHRVLGPCSSLKSALSTATTEHPDLAVVDIDLGGKNEGLEVVRRLKAELGVSAIFASGQADVARSHGDALGILHKPYDDEALQLSMPVLEAVMGGASPPPPSIPSALELF
jgi:two-component system, response regulator PdtaR